MNNWGADHNYLIWVKVSDGRLRNNHSMLLAGIPIKFHLVEFQGGNYSDL